MKLPNKEVIPFYVYGVVSVALCMVIGLVIFNLPIVWGVVLKLVSILSPFIYGFGIAFIFNPLLNILEYRIFGKIKTKRLHGRLFRVISLIITYLFALIILVVFFWIVTPEIVKSIQTLVANAGDYVNNITTWLGNAFPSDNAIVIWFVDQLPDIQESLVKILTDAIKNLENLQSVFEFGKGLASGIINFFVGVIISIYILIDKDRFKARFKKTVYALFKGETTSKLVYWLSYSSRSFTGYISGKLLDSLIVGLLCFIFMTIFNWPFAMLISVVVAVTNLIPFFGPFIGAIPSVLILFINDPWTALWFIVFIFALQQLDGNVIGPFVVGDSVGLSAFWIVFSILFFGGIFGIAGMLLGIPVFAVIYAITRTLIDRHLEKKGLPTDTTEYMTANVKKYNREYAERIASKKRLGDKLKERMRDKAKHQEDDDTDNK